MYGEDLDLGPPADPMDSYLLRIPAGTRVDGAVVELSSVDRRLVNAVLRIPAPKKPKKPKKPERM